MRKLAASAFAAMLSTALSAKAAPSDNPRFDFESVAIGQLPPGFSPQLTGPGASPSWSVRADEAAPSGSRVLVQPSAETHGRSFPICVYEGLLTHNVVVSVRLKPTSASAPAHGGAGLLAHFVDAENYWVLWVDTMGSRVHLDSVIDGTPREVASAAAPAATPGWRTLKLVVAQRHFEGFLDGKQVLTADSMALPETGEIGLWTKSASVAFDDLIIEDSDAGH